MVLRRLGSIVLLSLLALFPGAATAGTETAADPRQLWQLIDYIAVDYAGAVKDGQILDAGEYAEMRDFASTINTSVPRLPLRESRQQLTAQALDLSNAVEKRAGVTEVAGKARALADALIAAYPIPLSPKSPPDLERGRIAFENMCSGCHGLHGSGDGPAAHDLNPHPIAFTDRERSRQRSPFAYYQVISQGVNGTSMPAFAELSEADRWAVAFYVSTLSHTDADRERGQALWGSDSTSHRGMAKLEDLARASEVSFSTVVGNDRATAILSYARMHPEMVIPNNVQLLALAREKLTASVQAFKDGHIDRARELALSAYLDGFEPIEASLAISSSELLARIEAAMGHYRTTLQSMASAEEIEKEASNILGLFDLTERALNEHSTSRGAAFVGSFTILLREGMEALLVVVAILAFLRKAGRTELLPYVHIGWISALLAGAVTWLIATYVVGISGTNREMTEGLSSIFAAAVLLSVGLWMHGKSLAGRWQQYLHAKLSHALSRKSVWFLSGLAFVAVYREVFETILFYAALWTQGQRGAILTGLVVAALTLGIVAYLMIRATTRLPIGKFFGFSASLVGLLAIVLAGKGISALQEAGLLNVHSLGTLRIDTLGIYPSIETTTAQLLVIATVAIGFLVNHSHARRHRRSA